MNKICLIDQPAGLGDIFFCQKIAETFLHNDYDVISPVKDSIKWIGEYLINSIPVIYTSEKIEITKETITIKLDGSQYVTNHPFIMMSKYKLLDIDWNDWLEYFNFKRNKDKENSLYYDVLKLKDNDKYTFVNKYYGTPPGHLTYQIDVDINDKIVNLELLDDFTIFDWIKVIENANKIAIIDSCLNYIIEKISMKAQEMVCYCRQGKFTFEQIEPLFKKPWRYIY